MVRGIIVAASDIRQTHFVRAAERGMKIVSYDNPFPERAAIDTRCSTASRWTMSPPGAWPLSTCSNAAADIVFATEATLTVGRSHKIDGFLSALGHSLSERQRVIEGKANSAYGDTEMFELGLTLAPRVLALTPRPDGIVAINDALGIGLMVGLRAAGVQVPADISVIGIDNIALAGLAEPGLTSVRPPLAEMAQLMVERLIGRINNDAQPPGEFLPPTVISRRSVKAAG